MSQENVEVVRECYAAWNRGDMEGLGEQFAPNATVHPLADFADSLIRHGRDEILLLFAEVREPWERDESTAEEVVEAGDYVVTAHLWRAVMRGTEDEVEMRVGITWALHEGKVKEMRFYRHFAEALEAVGLRE
jgi:ketosteroid isomerase-like protein